MEKKNFYLFCYFLLEYREGKERERDDERVNWALAVSDCVTIASLKKCTQNMRKDDECEKRGAKQLDNARKLFICCNRFTH